MVTTTRCGMHITDPKTICSTEKYIGCTTAGHVGTYSIDCKNKLKTWVQYKICGTLVSGATGATYIGGKTLSIYVDGKKVAGKISATNAQGRVSVLYTFPPWKSDATLKVVFDGDSAYSASSREMKVHFETNTMFWVALILLIAAIWYYYLK